MTAYLAVFWVAFLAATLLPFYSEVLVVGLLVDRPDEWFWIWLVASVGNTLGSVVNWLLGRFLLRYQDRKWFPFKMEKLSRSQRWFQKYGVWSLLMAWAPVGGDALTFVAGVMRVPFWLFSALTFAGKAGRYLVVVWITALATSA
jgi:membrane protein YqaA with SNARE-associated domain